MGDTLEYTVTATNDGNVTLNNVVVSDTQLTPNNATCTTLAPAATCVLTGDHVVTLAEADVAVVVNTAGVVSDEITTSVPSNTVNTTVENDESLAIIKSIATLKTDADSSSDITLGDTLEYTVTATNDGNVTLNNVVVSDTQLTPNNVTCITLAPAAICVLTGDHVVTVTEADAAVVVNTAGVVSTEITTSVPSNTVNTPVENDASIGFVKIARPITPAAFIVGATVTYDYVITNTGNVTITTPITVTDNLIPAMDINCDPWPGGLALAGTYDCVGTYTVTSNDIAIGSVTNLASASDGTITSPTDSETVPSGASPALTVVKTSVDTSYASVGEILDYTYEVENTGNTAFVADIMVTDDKIGTFVCWTSTAGTDPDCQTATRRRTAPAQMRQRVQTPADTPPPPTGRVWRGGAASGGRNL